MGSVKYYIENKNHLIFLQFSYNNKQRINGETKYLRFKYSTGIKLDPKFWDIKKCRPLKEHLDHKKKNNLCEINHFLNEVENLLLNTYRKLLNDSVKITNELLKKQLDQLSIFGNKRIETKDQETTFDFFSFYENYLEKMISGKLTMNGKIISKLTWQNYRTTYNLIKEFSEHTDYKIDFDTIDMNFYHDFVSFMEDEKDYSTNTKGKHIKNLKTILNKASEIGINKNLKYKNKGFIKLIGQGSYKPYLTKDEIIKLYNLDLSAKPHLEYTRDFFVVACLTGFRISDVKTLNKSNFDFENNVIRKNTLKTSALVEIPINPKVRSIAERINYNFDVKSDKEKNKNIKEICQLAGFDNVIQDHVTGESFKKYERIVIHTGRRSLATNMYLEGIEIYRIMLITGHKSETVFLSYIGLTKQENAKKLQDSNYFK